MAWIALFFTWLLGVFGLIDEGKLDGYQEDDFEQGGKEWPG